MPFPAARIVVTAVCCLVTLAQTASLRDLALVGRALDDGGPHVAAHADASLAVVNPAPNPAVGLDQAVQPGTELRILCVGDSIAYGSFSNTDGGDGNGYRLQLRDALAKDRVVYAGTVLANGTMNDDYVAAWPGKTIKYIADHVGPSLEQQPNIILLHAGTNDLTPFPSVSTEGNNATLAAGRLGALVDQMIEACPDAVILVAMIIPICLSWQVADTHHFQSLIPGVARKRYDQGHHVLTANLTSFPVSELRDCVHPTNDGYDLLGDYWYNLVRQIPRDWIKAPVGSNPNRTGPPDRGNTSDTGHPASLSSAVGPSLAFLCHDCIDSRPLLSSPKLSFVSGGNRQLGSVGVLVHEHCRFNKFR